MFCRSDDRATTQKGTTPIGSLWSMGSGFIASGTMGRELGTLGERDLDEWVGIDDIENAMRRVPSMIVVGAALLWLGWETERHNWALIVAFTLLLCSRNSCW